jgi:hypothetical protein
MRMDICDIRRLPLKRSSAWEELAGSAWLEDEQPILADPFIHSLQLYLHRGPVTKLYGEGCLLLLEGFCRAPILGEGDCDA